MKKILIKHTVVLLILVVVTAGCHKQPNNVDGNEANENFCSYLNVENIDKTIPIVNEFLNGLSAYLDAPQQLEELVAWLLSCSCIIDATVECESCTETKPPQSEILISFDENGTTKKFLLEVSMTWPLRVKGYREYEEPKELFCSYLNVDDIDFTIPVVNQFLSGLAANLEDEQQIQELTAWLKSQPCIINAYFLKENSMMYEILISFDENGTEKIFIMDVSM